MAQHLQMDEVTNFQLHMIAQEALQQINTINMEMQHTKQVVGIQITLTLCFQTTLSLVVEVAVTMMMAQEFSTSSGARGSSDRHYSFRLALVV